MIGTTMGRYRILEPIGRGGMGQVFLAEDPVLSRRLAVKVLPPEFTHDLMRRERLLHEARAASALNHPNIIVVHDLGESEGALFIAMEVVDGPTLRGWAREKREPAEILRLMRQATAALQVAHAAGLVHRDLKPENMLVRKDGLLKILDFGLARSITPAEGRTATMPGTVMGTAPYMSPEQVLGKPAGPTSDVFSLGTILYELLTGHHPFAAESSVETMHRILHDTPESPSRLNRALNADFDFVLAKALSKDPTRRHASMRDLDVDLETLECGCGPAAKPASSGPGAPAGPRAIAVLPFKNIGGNPELNFLGVGLADAVITRLSSSPDLVVRATSSITIYENQPVDPRRVGQELEVSAILDASYQKAGDRFRATARLIDTPSGRAIWAGKVDLRYDDIFEVQDQVAQGIADALTARISRPTAADGGPASGEYKPSPEAFELVMRGLEALRSANREGNLQAIREFQRAVLLEPGYARAWASLGSIMHSMIDGGFDSDPTWYVKAQGAIERARALDPEDGLAIFATAKLHLVFGRKREAHADLLTARRRMPNNPDVYHYIAYLFRLCNMLDEAVEAEQVALDLDPLLPWWYWGMIRIHLLRRDWAAVESWLERAEVRFPRHPRLLELRGEALVEEGRFEEAARHFETRAQEADAPGAGLFYRVLARFQIGDEVGARARLHQVEAYARVDMDFAAKAAVVWAHLGDKDKAFEFLDRAVALGNDTLVRFESPLLFDPLHGDPRWGPFLEAMRGRVAEFRREFRWPLPD